MTERMRNTGRSAGKERQPRVPSLLDSEGEEDLLINDLFSFTSVDVDKVGAAAAPEERNQLGGAVDEVGEAAAAAAEEEPGVEYVDVVWEADALEERGDGLTRGGAIIDDDAINDESGTLPMGVCEDKAADDEPGVVGTENPPAMEKAEDDYVTFFERTVPKLDVSVVASHDRLLLCRSRSRYFVCDPAANRWLALPPSSIPPTLDTARGFHYNINSVTGRVAFTVVLLVRVAMRRVVVETFSSTTGRWDTKVIAAHGVARCLPVASPGIHSGTNFYWLSHRKVRIVSYDVACGHASVLREPPEAEGSKARVDRSLGSTGGRLRVCTFDIFDEKSEKMLPHDGITGEHGVWLMMDGADNGEAWRRVLAAVVDDISVYYFLSLFNHEVPVDFAGASGGSIIVNKNHFFLRYDLETGNKVRLMGIYTNDGRLGALYKRFHAFPFFRPG